MNIKKYLAEFIGTMFLVLFGCGVAAITTAANNFSILLTSLAFGFALLVMIYAFDHISGCHLNPAVSLAMLLNKKISIKEFIFYLIAQIMGAMVGSLEVAMFKGSFTSLGANQVSNFLIDNYDKASAMIIGLVVEIILTCGFVLVVLFVSNRKNDNTNGLVIGASLALTHFLGINLTGTSVNPARSLAPAIFECFGERFTSIKQIWIFIIGPLIGAVLAYFIYRFFVNKVNKKSE